MPEAGAASFIPPPRPVAPVEPEPAAATEPAERDSGVIERVTLPPLDECGDGVQDAVARTSLASEPRQSVADFVARTSLASDGSRPSAVDRTALLALDATEEDMTLQAVPDPVAELIEEPMRALEPEPLVAAPPVEAPAPPAEPELSPQDRLLAELRPLLVKFTIEANRALPEDLFLFLKTWADNEIEATKSCRSCKGTGWIWDGTKYDDCPLCTAGEVRQSVRRSVRASTDAQAEKLLGGIVADGLANAEVERRDTCEPQPQEAARRDSCMPR